MIVGFFVACLLRSPDILEFYAGGKRLLGIEEKGGSFKVEFESVEE